MYWFIPELFDLVKAALWPAVVLIIFYFLRAPIIEFINRIKFLKGKGFEISTEKQIEKINLEIAANDDPNSIVNSQEFKKAKSDLALGNSRNLFNNNSLEPYKICVIETWISFESTLRKIQSQYMNKSKSELVKYFWSYTGTQEVLKELYSQKHITGEDFKLISDLRIARNNIVHGDDVSISEDKVKSLIINIEAIRIALEEKIEKNDIQLRTT